LVALTLEAKRDAEPRRIDLMTAAVASARGLPLHTRNEDDFKGLQDMVEVIAV
jgi:predicted nucleic acid-binding protein